MREIRLRDKIHMFFDLGAEGFPPRKIAFFVIVFFVLALVLFALVNIIGIVFASEPSIKMVSGTEYISNEEGQIIARLQDSAGNPILGASCIVSLLYPDKSFVFIDNQMQATTVPGNYYYSFLTPETNGVYEENIRCTVTHNNQQRELAISSSFHVSAGLNLIVEVSRSQREQFDEMLAEFEDTQAKINFLQEFIDTNLYTDLNLMMQRVNDLNNQFIETQEHIDQTVHDSVSTNFNSLYQKFKQTYIASADIFDTN